MQLRPGEEERANSYFKRWDNAVVISMGNQTFVPPGCPQPRPPASCGDLEGSDHASAGIRLEVIPDSPTLLASDWGHAQLLVTNTGTSRFEIDSGIPIVGAVVTPHTEHIVGSNFGFIAGTGGGVNLAPGEHGTIEVVFGAARCDGQPGSALPPGTYGLRVRLTAEGLPDPNRPVYLSPEVPITITK